MKFDNDTGERGRMLAMPSRAWDWYRTRGRYHRRIAVSDLLIAGDILALWFVWRDPKIYGQVSAAIFGLLVIYNQLDNHRILGGEIVVKDDKQTPRLAWYLGRAVWWWIVSVTWACLGGLLLILGVAWSFGYSVSLVALAIAGAVLIAIQYAARQQARGWITDERGERQKVNYWLGDTAIYTPTTRSQRVVEEGVLRQERRMKLLAGAIALTVSLLVSWWVWNMPRPGVYVFLYLVTFIFGAMGALATPYYGTLELLYLTGFPHMKGAKVRDPEPPKPGLDEVKKQKAHGDAHLASQIEALALLDEMG